MNELKYYNIPRALICWNFNIFTWNTNWWLRGGRKMIFAKPQGIPQQLMDKHIQNMKETSVLWIQLSYLLPRVWLTSQKPKQDLIQRSMLSKVLGRMQRVKSSSVRVLKHTKSCHHIKPTFINLRSQKSTVAKFCMTKAMKAKTSERKYRSRENWS